MLSQRLSNLSSGKTKRWPNPQDSTGVYLAILGRNKTCWEAKGPARSVFNILQGKIREYIDQTCEPLSADVVWSLYMIGRIKETASPTIAFISREPGPRQRLKTLIKESKILEEYPGFITMDIDRPPGCRSSVVKTLGELDEAYSDAKKAPAQQILASVRSNNFMGTSIYLPERGPELVATGGGLVQLKEKLFMISVAHPFEKHWNDRFPESASLGDYIFEIDEISDDEDGNETLVDMTSGGSITSNSTPGGASDCSLNIDIDSNPWSDNAHFPEGPTATTNVVTEVSPSSAQILAIPSSARVGSKRFGDLGGHTLKSDKDEIPRQPEALDIPTSGSLPLTFDLRGPMISSAKGGTIELDYSLFELPDSILQRRDSATIQRQPASISEEARSTEVIVYTASGRVAGRLLATPSFIQPAQGMLLQQLWTVIMEGTLEKGLCGSWVVDVSSGDVFGHIIAGAPEDGFAYMVPFYEILDDLNLHFGDGWSLVDARELSFESSPGEAIPPQSLSPRDSINLQECIVSALDMTMEPIDSSELLKDYLTGNEVWPTRPKNLGRLADYGGRSPKSEFSSWVTRNSVIATGDNDGSFIHQDKLRAHFSKTEKADNLSAPLHATLEPSDDVVDAEAIRESYLKASLSKTQLQQQIQPANTRSLEAKPVVEDTAILYKPFSQSMMCISSDQGGEEKLVQTIPKALYQRPSHTRIWCKKCDDYPEGFRGEHELQRHIDRQHKIVVKKWVCIEPRDGLSGPDHPEPIKPLSKCKVCSQLKKRYGAYYNAAAHLRRAHFNPKPKCRGKEAKGNEKSTEKPGGKSVSDWPPMTELKRWMGVVEELVYENEPQQPEQEDESDGSDDDYMSLDYSEDSLHLLDNSLDFPVMPAIDWNFLESDNDYMNLDYSEDSVYLVGNSSDPPTMPAIDWNFLTTDNPMLNAYAATPMMLNRSHHNFSTQKQEKQIEPIAK